MARKSCVLYDSWGTIIMSLQKEQAGEIAQAICKYVFADEEPVVEDPALNAIFVMIKQKLDEDGEAYKEKVNRMLENRNGKDSAEVTQKSRRSHKDICKKSDRNHTEVTQKSRRSHKDITSVSVTVSDTDTVSVTDTVTDNVSPSEIEKPKRTQAALVGESDLSEPVKEKLMEWLKYKKERKDKFGETALMNLITTVRKHEQESGSIAVINLISLCMSNGWQGIIWDKLKPTARSGTTEAGVRGEWAKALMEVEGYDGT